MALSKATFKADIKAILTVLKEYDGTSGKEMDDAVEKFADDLATAIDDYIKSATVTATGSCGGSFAHVAGPTVITGSAS